MKTPRRCLSVTTYMGGPCFQRKSIWCRTKHLGWVQNLLERSMVDYGFDICHWQHPYYYYLFILVSQCQAIVYNAIVDFISASLLPIYKRPCPKESSIFHSAITLDRLIAKNEDFDKMFFKLSHFFFSWSILLIVPSYVGYPFQMQTGIFQLPRLCIVLYNYCL